MGEIIKVDFKKKIKSYCEAIDEQNRIEKLEQLSEVLAKSWSIFLELKPDSYNHREAYHELIQEAYKIACYLPKSDS